MYPDLTGKVVIVTGSAKSIGKGIAKEFSRQGAIVIVADMNASAGERTVKEIRERGGTASFIEMDLTRREQVMQVVEKTVQTYGRLDVLVNNASVVEPLKPFLELSMEEWNYVVGGNLNGVFALSQAAARTMSEQDGGGSIIHILAIQSQRPLPGYSAYSTSKGGLEALTRAMAVELTPRGIRVNGIAVGAVYADSVRRNLPQDQYPAVDDYDQVPPELDEASMTLVGRLGRPYDVGKMAAFLASSESSFMTGSVIRLDGGRFLYR